MKGVLAAGISLSLSVGAPRLALSDVSAAQGAIETRSERPESVEAPDPHDGDDGGGRSNPWVRFRESYRLPVVRVADPAQWVAAEPDPKIAGELLPRVAAEADTSALSGSDSWRGLALLIRDLDRSGAPELLAGYASGERGILVVHRGCVMAPRPGDSFSAEPVAEGDGRTLTPFPSHVGTSHSDASAASSPIEREDPFSLETCAAPFLPLASAYSLPSPPHFLVTGDFDADGHLDVVAATRGGRELHFLEGDGRGGLSLTRSLPLHGEVTALASGEMDQPDWLEDLAVGLLEPSGPSVLLYRFPLGALYAEPESVILPEAATDLVFGPFDAQPHNDLVVAAGMHLVLIHGLDTPPSQRVLQDSWPRSARSIQSLAIPSRILSLTDGWLTVGSGIKDLAILTDAGEILIANWGDLRAGTPERIARGLLSRPRRVSAGAGEYSEGEASKPGHGVDTGWANHGPSAFSADLEPPAQESQTVRSGSGVEPRVFTAALRGDPPEDLVLLDPGTGRLRLVSADVPTSLISEAPPPAVDLNTLLDVESGPVALAAARLNRDGQTDFVFLTHGTSAPSISLTAPLATFTVDNAGNLPDAAPGNGVCATAGGMCTFRAALMEANALPGADSVQFALGSGTPTITAPNLPAITDVVTILGATGGATRIQLNGASTAGPGIEVDATGSNSSIQSLVINRFMGVGVRIDGAGVTVANCLIGTDASGTGTVSGNVFGGIIIDGPTATGNTIGGTSAAERNVVSNNQSAGIVVQAGARSNRIEGNIIGMDGGGTMVLSNFGHGVAILSSPLNVIGGNAATPGAPPGNLISRNGGTGASISGSASTDNLVAGNIMGLDAGGSAPHPNFQDGVNISGASRNVVGGAAAGARNVISANVAHGVSLAAGASANTVAGNYIGPRLTGTSAVGNGMGGVRVQGASTNNTIGGSVALPGTGAGNLISGNTSFGVRIDGTGTSNNRVQGNLIGTNAGGDAPLGNAGDGVAILDSTDNTVGGDAPDLMNVISGNFPASAQGIEISGGGSTRNTVSGNLVGTDMAGTASVANVGGGVTVANGAHDNTIGGPSSAPGAPPGNVISGNSVHGVRIEGGATVANRVEGNLIGTDLSGTAALGNLGPGVVLSGAAGNTIGGTLVGHRNVISGNSGSGADGVLISGNGGSGNTVAGNFIGTDLAGVSDLGNGGAGVRITGPGAAASNTIGGTAFAAIPPGNVISGNARSGITMSLDASSNIIEGNLIGTDVGGTSALANAEDGIAIVGGVSNKIIGNVVSGNGPGLAADGVSIGASALSNAVLGNHIGTDRPGVTSIRNGGHGVAIESGAGSNVIGGATPTPGTGVGNVISGNSNAGSNGVLITGAGTANNRVEGNLIGVAVDGGGALPNGANGVLISSGASGNTIGGQDALRRNVISGNDLFTTSDGVEINVAISNTVSANFIGTNAAGTSALPNGGDGVLIIDPSNQSPANLNVVGGDTPGRGNVISGNLGNGLQISGPRATDNRVLGNSIGLAAGGTGPLPNTLDGILITTYASGNSIGSTTGTGSGTCTGACNAIAANWGAGVRVSHFASTQNAIRANSLFDNLGLGIDLGFFSGVTPNDPGDPDIGANTLQNFPSITGASFDGGSTSVEGSLNGAASTTFTIDLFGNSSPDPSGFGEGRTYWGSTDCTTDGSGNGTWALIVPGSPTLLSATATSPNRNTSEFSGLFVNPDEARNLFAERGPGTSVEIVFEPACGAADHAVYVGSTPIPGALGWTAAFCGLGVSGAAAFDPGNPAPGVARYFVVVGYHASREGSYGRDSAMGERPEAVGLGACDRAQETTVTCPGAGIP